MNHPARPAAAGSVDDEQVTLAGALSHGRRTWVQDLNQGQQQQT